MFEIVDYRFEWCQSYSWLHICMKRCETGEHFYIKRMITSTEQADEWLAFWEDHTTLFFDVEYQHPN